MVWVWVVVGGAVGGLVMLAVFAVVLWRKTRVLFHELAELEALEELQVTLERSDPPAVGETQGFVLELLGDDRPGIVAEISAALAEVMARTE